MLQGDAMGGPLEKPIQRPGPNISRIYSVYVLLAGELKVARTVDLLQLLVMSNSPSAQPSRLVLQAPPSFPLTPRILQLPSSSSSSPLWHWSETPMGHTVGNEIKTGICKDDAFLDSLIDQMLSWESGHLSTQVLPIPNRLLLAELLRERWRKFGTENPKPSYIGMQKDLLTLCTCKRKWEMTFMAGRGTSKRETIPIAHIEKDFFALSADIKEPKSQQKTIIIPTLKPFALLE